MYRFLIVRPSWFKTARIYIMSDLTVFPYFSIGSYVCSMCQDSALESLAFNSNVPLTSAVTANSAFLGLLIVLPFFDAKFLKLLEVLWVSKGRPSQPPGFGRWLSLLWRGSLLQFNTHLFCFYSWLLFKFFTCSVS